jgi:hypothetical protein
MFPAVPDAVVASLIAGIATGVGALPILLIPGLERLQDTLLGFSAGIMLAASFFSLILRPGGGRGPLRGSLHRGVRGGGGDPVRRGQPLAI